MARSTRSAARVPTVESAELSETTSMDGDDATATPPSNLQPGSPQTRRQRREEHAARARLWAEERQRKKAARSKAAAAEAEEEIDAAGLEGKEGSGESSIKRKRSPGAEDGPGAAAASLRKKAPRKSATAASRPVAEKAAASGDAAMEEAQNEENGTKEAAGGRVQGRGGQITPAKRKPDDHSSHAEAPSSDSKGNRRRRRSSRAAAKEEEAAPETDADAAAAAAARVTSSSILPAVPENGDPQPPIAVSEAAAAELAAAAPQPRFPSPVQSARPTMRASAATVLKAEPARIETATPPPSEASSAPTAVALTVGGGRIIKMPDAAPSHPAKSDADAGNVAAAGPSPTLLRPLPTSMDSFRKRLKSTIPLSRDVRGDSGPPSAVEILSSASVYLLMLLSFLFCAAVFYRLIDGTSGLWGPRLLPDYVCVYVGGGGVNAAISSEDVLLNVRLALEDLMVGHACGGEGGWSRTLPESSVAWELDGDGEGSSTEIEVGEGRATGPPLFALDAVADVIFEACGEKEKEEGRTISRGDVIATLQNLDEGDGGWSKGTVRFFPGGEGDNDHALLGLTPAYAVEELSYPIMCWVQSLTIGCFVEVVDVLLTYPMAMFAAGVVYLASFVKKLTIQTVVSTFVAGVAMGVLVGCTASTWRDNFIIFTCGLVCGSVLTKNQAFALS